MNDLRVRGKKFLVAGSTGPIGLALVDRLLMLGAELVIIVGRQNAANQVWRMKLKNKPVDFYNFDILLGIEPTLPSSLVLDGAFFCVGDAERVYAGIGVKNPTDEEKYADLKLHVNGLFRFIDVFSRYVRDGGRIVVTGSIVSERPEVKGMRQKSYRDAKLCQRDMVKNMREVRYCKGGRIFLDLYFLGVVDTEKNRASLRRVKNVVWYIRWLLRLFFSFISISVDKVVNALLYGFGKSEHVTLEVLPKSKF